MKRARTRKEIFRTIRCIITLAIAAVAIFIYFRNNHIGQDTRFDAAEHLQERVVTVDGKELNLRDLMFYIAYEEQDVEQKAKIYNPKDTNKYWNLHTNGVFIRLEAKDAVIDMAVHDEIFYEKALEEDLQLSANDLEYLEGKQSDFISDLLEEQKESLASYGIDDESLEQAMYKVALAQKYQKYYFAQQASDSEYDYDDYDAQGYAYKELLKKEHTYEINDDLWDELSMGNVTLTHGKKK